MPSTTYCTASAASSTPSSRVNTICPVRPMQPFELRSEQKYQKAAQDHDRDNADEQAEPDEFALACARPAAPRR